ncbi:hypothetical protein HDU91_003673 [Kappamyces sp. JEL0680]|nr:hypothetical protein HDU91_003673 [Kappamyces sp. JEL0680]
MALTKLAQVLSLLDSSLSHDANAVPDVRMQALEVLSETLVVLVQDMHCREETTKVLLQVLSFGTDRKHLASQLQLLRGLHQCVLVLGLDLYKYVKQIVGVCCRELEYGGSTVHGQNTEKPLVLFGILRECYEQTALQWQPLVPVVFVCICSWWRDEARGLGGVDSVASTSPRDAALALVRRFKTDFAAVMQPDCDALAALHDPIYEDIIGARP